MFNLFHCSLIRLFAKFFLCLEKSGEHKKKKGEIASVSAEGVK